MKVKLTLLMIGMLFVGTIYGQQKLSFKTNVGIANGTKLIDGYYFSFGIGIPVFKFLEIAPTFTNASMLPNTYIDNSWNIDGTVSHAWTNEGPRKPYLTGKNMSSISLLFLFKPFALIKNEKFKKHELLIGTGLSYNSNIKISSQYEINGANHELIAFMVKSERTFELYYEVV